VSSGKRTHNLQRPLKLLPPHQHLTYTLRITNIQPILPRRNQHPRIPQLQKRLRFILDIPTPRRISHKPSRPLKGQQFQNGIEEGTEGIGCEHPEGRLWIHGDDDDGDADGEGGGVVGAQAVEEPGEGGHGEDEQGGPESETHGGGMDTG
jgi:hypothetical protein